MNLFVFYDTPKYEKRFRQFAKTYEALFDNLHLTYLPFSKDIPINNGFHLFIINSQRANSSFLLETTMYLKEHGAHDQSFLFLLNDIEKLTKEDGMRVLEDIRNTLQAALQQPEIKLVSFEAFYVLEQYDKESTITEFIFPDEAGQIKSLKQVILERDLESIIRFSGMNDLQEAIARQFIEQPNLSFKRNKKQRLLIAEELNEAIYQELLKEEDLFIQFASNKNEFKSLMKDKESLGITSIPYKKVTEEKLETFKQMVVLIDGENFKHPLEIEEDIERWQHLSNDSVFVPVTSYPLRQHEPLNEQELVNNQAIVITNTDDFPIPKTTVTNWHQALCESSRLHEAVKVIKSYKRG